MGNKTIRMEMLVPIILILLSSVVHLGTSCCAQKERLSSLLDVAMDVISRAKSEDIKCPEEQDFNFKNETVVTENLDCGDLYRKGHKKSGVYTISTVSRLTSLKKIDVYCDMDTDGGGWTVIQRRGKFGRPNNFFEKDWGSYKKGFGDLEKDFWFGNDKIFAMTNQRLYSVRMDMEDERKNKAYAHYDNFWVDDEFQKYTLHISGYKGSAGDAMKEHDTMKFTTMDEDNDPWVEGNCALRFRSGWWFRECYKANLNGMYNNATDGIHWLTWKNPDYLPRAEIKIRPFTF